MLSCLTELSLELMDTLDWEENERKPLLKTDSGGAVGVIVSCERIERNISSTPSK